MGWLKEFRWHGRGGQGVWTASELLARAALSEGKYAQAFPEFGPERTGAPVSAYTRISDEPVYIRCAIYEPDVVIVIDPTLIKAAFVTKGLREGGSLIVNSREKPTKVREESGLPSTVSVWAVPATDIAVKALGMPITNTAMLGAVTRATNIVSLSSVKEAIRVKLPLKVVERNILAIDEAYEEVELG